MDEIAFISVKIISRGFLAVNSLLFTSFFEEICSKIQPKYEVKRPVFMKQNERFHETYFRSFPESFADEKVMETASSSSCSITESPRGQHIAHPVARLCGHGGAVPAAAAKEKEECQQEFTKTEPMCKYLFVHIIRKIPGAEGR